MVLFSILFLFLLPRRLLASWVFFSLVFYVSFSFTYLLFFLFRFLTLILLLGKLGSSFTQTPVQALWNRIERKRGLNFKNLIYHMYLYFQRRSLVSS